MARAEEDSYFRLLVEVIAPVSKRRSPDVDPDY
jgi:hypothetical protein